jgi:predicted nucleic acid-binding protein
MVGRDKVVVDASVVLSWLLPDEKLTKKANSLYERYVDGDIMLVAPDLLRYEVVNGIRSAVVQKRIGKKHAIEAIKKLFELGLEFENQSGAFDKILEMSLKHKLSAYDTSYVVLAKKLKSKLASFDKRLLKNAKGLSYF